MSYMKRARELVLAGYSEADAYRIVAQERRDADAVAETSETSEATDPLDLYREADGNEQEAA